MLFHCLGSNEDVVHIDEYKFCVNEILEELIHHGLECCRRVGKTKEHHQGFKHPFIHLEGSFPFVTFLDSNIVISHHTSNLVKICASLSLSMTSGMRGNGY